MSLPNLQLWAKTDPANDINVPSAQLVIITSMRNNVRAFLASPATYNYTGDFTIAVDAKAFNPGATCLYVPFMLCDTNDSRSGIRNAGGSFFDVYFQRSSGIHRITLEESDSGTTYTDTFIPWIDNTIYTFIVSRDLSVGTYGTLKCKIYTDYDHDINDGTLVDTLSVVLHSSIKVFDRHQTATSNEGGGTSPISGEISYYDDNVAPSGNAAYYYQMLNNNRRGR